MSTKSKIISASLFSIIMLFSVLNNTIINKDRISAYNFQKYYTGEKIISDNIKPYTIMIYMNGSDLESEIGAATDDIIEMLESGLSSDSANLLIFTGGTNRWQNDVIPENECVIWEIRDGKIYEVRSVGLVNMGNADTLSGFIDFGMENYKAQKYGLILWDHGGGSIAGYGHDEKFNNDNLSLLDMDYAFEKSDLNKNKLEFIGFDSCLMASVEMAVIASNYAKYLIASEDLTPGDGWDYAFLSTLNYNPLMSGAELGVFVTDFFMDYYGRYSREDLNMSVIDLSHVNNVMNSMGELMQKASSSLENDVMSSFRALSRRRSSTRTFGIGSPRDNESDMVDIGDMAYKLVDLYPYEAEKLFMALDNCVIYNKNNSGNYLSGLSTFYIYGGRDSAKESLETYMALGMDENYTEFLINFSGILLNENIYMQNNKSNLIQSNLTVWYPLNDKPGYFIMKGIKNDPKPNDLWPSINENNVCMYKVNDFHYAIAASVNGKDCDIIILIDEEHPDGKVLGARYDDGFIIQKGYDQIEDGNVISLYYPQRYFNKEGATEEKFWYKGNEFIVNGELELDWKEIIDEEYYYSIRFTCVQNREYFTSLV